MFTLPLCKIKGNIFNQMLVTCKEGKLSNSSVPYSFCYFHYYISLTINNLVLFLLVGCEIASLEVIKCADLRTFLLLIMFDRRAFPVQMLPFAVSTINTTTWHTTWQRKKKGRHKFTYFRVNIVTCPRNVWKPFQIINYLRGFSAVL